MKSSIRLFTYRVIFNDKSHHDIPAVRHFGRDASHVFLLEDGREIAIPVHKVSKVNPAPAAG